MREKVYHFAVAIGIVDVDFDVVAVVIFVCYSMVVLDKRVCWYTRSTQKDFKIGRHHHIVFKYATEMDHIAIGLAGARL